MKMKKNYVKLLMKNVKNSDGSRNIRNQSLYEIDIAYFDYFFTFVFQPVHLLCADKVSSYFDICSLA